MNWTLVRSKDPQFQEFTKPYQDYEKRTLEALRNGEHTDPLPFFSADDWSKPNGLLLFVNAEGTKRTLVSVGCEIKFLSEVDASNQEAVIDLLLSDMVSENSDEKNRIRRDEPIVRHTLHTAETDDDCPGYVVCSFDSEFRTTGHTSWKAKAVYLDLPWSDCIRWFRQFEETLRKINPRVKFHNGVGVCSRCGISITLEESGGKCGLGFHECKQCVTMASLAEAQERKISTIPHKIAALNPQEKLGINKNLRLAIYQVYRGRCQYCSKPEQLSRNEMHIEHIIPRAIQLEKVPKMLQEMGISRTSVRSFATNLLPPYHNCALNYSLACSHHNYSKSGRLLNPVALEMLLHRARMKSKRVLLNYAELITRSR